MTDYLRQSARRSRQKSFERGKIQNLTDFHRRCTLLGKPSAPRASFLHFFSHFVPPPTITQMSKNCSPIFVFVCCSTTGEEVVPSRVQQRLEEREALIHDHSYPPPPHRSEPIAHPPMVVRPRANRPFPQTPREPEARAENADVRESAPIQSRACIFLLSITSLTLFLQQRQLISRGQLNPVKQRQSATTMTPTRKVSLLLLQQLFTNYKIRYFVSQRE